MRGPREVEATRIYLPLPWLPEFSWLPELPWLPDLPWLVVAPFFGLCRPDLPWLELLELCVVLCWPERP
ncbi:MAG TPA: hypothetical protein VIU81_10520 [Gaiellaceae bacterium]